MLVERRFKALTYFSLGVRVLDAALGDDAFFLCRKLRRHRLLARSPTCRGHRLEFSEELEASAAWIDLKAELSKGRARRRWREHRWHESPGRARAQPQCATAVRSCAVGQLELCGRTALAVRPDSSSCASHSCELCGRTARAVRSHSYEQCDPASYALRNAPPPHSSSCATAKPLRSASFGGRTAGEQCGEILPQCELRQ